MVFAQLLLLNGQTFRAAPVLDVRIEWDVGADRRVPFPDGLEEFGGIHAVELLRKLLDRIRRHLGDLADLVFVAQQVLHFLIENLPGELTGLLQHHATIFGVGIIAEIRAFVDEALAHGVDQNAERIGMLLKLIADRKVSELGRVHLPLHGMATRPIAARARADLERHADAVAGIEARTAHFGEIPARPEIARAPFGVGLEAAAGEHHGSGAQFPDRAVLAHPHTFDARSVIRRSSARVR